MTSEDIKYLAGKLESSKVHFRKRVQDVSSAFVGNRQLTEPIDWETAIVVIMTKTGWSIGELVDEAPSDAKVIKIY